MENFVVSARKYRPTTFNSVVGQRSITNTLKNAIKTEHLAQAFLFCGSRGVGKTTCARILAKTINCFNRTENIEACDECDSCKSFNEGASLNIYELDAASNNSVDDIRNLIDQVRFAPQIGSHKVYIIDEVHMLSTSAFNAFLKTLEEPPPHAIFILATTEKHKIIPTILSRCQIFDFSRIGVEDITNHLKEIASKENIKAEEEGLQIIAQKSDGALRDALSMFDQLVSFAGNELTYQSVIENLNILDYDYYFQATDYLTSSNIPQALLLFDKILQNGFDGHLFINGLASHFRNLLVCKDKQTIDLLEVGKSIKSKYLDQSINCSLSFLIAALEICRQCDTQYRASKNKRLLVELSLMQLASILNPDNKPEKKKPYIRSVEENLPLVNEEEGSIKNENKPTLIEESPVKSSEIIEKEETQSKGPELDSIEKSDELSTIKETPTIEKEVEVEKSEEVKNSNHNKFNKLSSQRAKSTSLSIKDLTSSNSDSEEEGKKDQFNSEDRTEFTLEEFNVSWKSLAEKIKNDQEEGNSIVYAAMINHEPKLEGNFKVSIAVDNKSQFEEMTLKRTDLHDFLRKNLKNGGIELVFDIQKNKKLKKAYTDEEKFTQLAELNPHLNTLKNKLGLDFM